MAVLPPDLTEELIACLAPLFRREEDRDARLIAPLSDWPGYDDILWSGTGRAFAARLTRQLPPDRLQTVLQALRQSDNLDEARITAWGERINAAAGLLAGEPLNVLTGYHRFLADRWSQPRYQLDSRFVQLTLLLDQGREATDIRFKPDPERGRYDSLTNLLADVPEKAVVLLGRPGSGKTTLLRRLQLESGWRELAQASGQTSLFVSLNSYRSAAPDGAPPPPLDWLRDEWRAVYPNLPDFDELFWHGRILLLLDGLNEIPHRDNDDYQALVGAWQAFWQRYVHLGNTAVFSCRSLDYSAPLTSEAAPVRQVQVEPLTPDQCRDFIVAYLPEQTEPVWAALRQDRQQLELFATPFFLQLLVEQVAETGEIPAGQAGLLTGFVRRALRREVVERKQRLFNPGVLFRQHDRQQVIHRAWGGPYALPGQGALLPKLAELAYEMQRGRESAARSQIRLPEADLRQLLADLQIDPPQHDDFIAAGIELNILDRALDRGEITFFHQLLQEYFAARALAQTPQPSLVATAWRSEQIRPRLADWLAQADVSAPLPAAPTTGWEETMLLAAAMTHDPEQFVTDLITANLPLAARCAAAPDVPVSNVLIERLQKELLARTADPEADLRARIAAAEALGELGDPRFERRAGPHGDYLLPPLARIPGRRYTIGNDDSQYGDEKPAHPAEITGFEMGVFTVTNAEYRLFVEAGGYKDERWWETEAARAWLKGEASTEGSKQYYRDLVGQLRGMTDEAIENIPNLTPETVEQLIWLKHTAADELEEQLEKWFPTGRVVKQPEYWDDSRFNQPAQPVVGVSWFEARAYCAWLSAQIDDEIKLPTEAEWEAAGRGEQGRQYAYGQEYDAANCNTFETHARRTTPIGVFPGGQTPVGIADLSGNVWEWTSSQYRPYPYAPTDGREDPEDAEVRRVLRGGSWYHAQNYARAASRFNYTPDYRSSDYSFRVVVVRRPPSHHDL